MSHAVGRRTVVAAGVVTALLVAVVLPVVVASASSNQVLIDVGDGHGWVRESPAPILDFQRMAPGMRMSAVLGVQNDSDSISSLTIRSLDIHDDDNGCNEPESFVDSTCGPGEGELGHQLIFRIYVDKSRSGTFAVTPIWSGTVYDLAVAAQLDAGMAAHAKWDLKLEVELPASSGNETQTDQIGFGLQITLASESGTSSTDVPGTTVGREGDGSIPPTGVLGTKERAGIDGMLGRLPFTGSPLSGAVEIAVGLLLFGAAMLIPGRRRSSRKSG